MARERMDPLTWLGIALVVAIGTMVVFGAWAMSAYGGYTGMMGGGGWTWGLVMMAVPGIVLVLILLVVLGGLDSRAPAPIALPSAPQPLDILEQRYARGELTREDYLRIRNDLSRGTNDS